MLERKRAFPKLLQWNTALSRMSLHAEVWRLLYSEDKRRSPNPTQELHTLSLLRQTLQLAQCSKMGDGLIYQIQTFLSDRQAEKRDLLLKNMLPLLHSTEK